MAGRKLFKGLECASRLERESAKAAKGAKAGGRLESCDEFGGRMMLRRAVRAWGVSMSINPGMAGGRGAGEVCGGSGHSIPPLRPYALRGGSGKWRGWSAEGGERDCQK